MERVGLYIHIPFCKRACFYCHFVKREYEPALVEQYIAALVKELRLLSNPGYIIDTIYIGGGSPSLLTESQAAAVMEAVSASWNLDPVRECTLEMNPEDVSRDKLRFLKKLGFNRLSLGTQSFVREDLDYLKRTHSVLQSRQAVELALAEGFSNINVDFIIGLPSQTLASLEESLSFLKNYNIPHVSAYLLETESTPGHLPSREEASGVEPGSEADDTEEKELKDNELYFFTEDFLKHLGYVHYEVSNYGKQGFQSRHNRKYWENMSYIGAGLSASGYEQGSDYKNTADFRDYFAALAGQKFPRQEVEQPDPALRRIVMGLRLLEGIPATHFKGYEEPLTMLLEGGFLIRGGERIAVNPRRMLLLNEILTYFFNPLD